MKEQKTTIPTDSIWHTYRNVVKRSREKAQGWRGNRNPEPPDFLLIEDDDAMLDFLEFVSYDEPMCVNDDFSKKYGYYLSEEWICSLLGNKWEDLANKLNIRKRYRPIPKHYTFYHHEIYIEKILDILIQIVDNDNLLYLRRRPLISELIQKNIYTSEDVMEILNVGESTLRAYRDNGQLDFSRERDKIWYTKQNLMDFMEKTSCNK